MKKVCFITISNTYMIPYLNLYLECKQGLRSIIVWDRDGVEDSTSSENKFIFYKRCKSGISLSKIKDFLLFRRYVKKILSIEEFDVIVLLQTQASILLADILAKRYVNKFIVDIRDYCHENLQIIRKIEEWLFPKALACVISSPGYKSFLPPGKYRIVHNLRKLLQNDEDRNFWDSAKVNKRSLCHKLNIGYVGLVAYQDMNKKMIMQLKDDKRFALSFYGARALELQDFCEDNNALNVDLKDRFHPSEILALYKDVDFVNNLYGHGVPLLDYALSNKLYIAAELHIPILVFAKTYMAEVVGKYGLGLVIDEINGDFGDKLWTYYSEMDWDVFDRGCEKFLRDVNSEQEKVTKYLKEVLN